MPANSRWDLIRGLKGLISVYQLVGGGKMLMFVLQECT